MTLQKSKDIDNILILQTTFDLSDDIVNSIRSYLFDFNYFKKMWDLRIKESLSIIDKGYKYIPIYRLPSWNIFNSTANTIIYYCVECYIEALIQKKSYIDTIDCNNCNQIQNMNLVSIVKYKIISYDEFKERKELKDIINMYGYRNIKAFIHSNKYLTEMILLGNYENYKSRIGHLLVLYEINQLFR